MVSDDVGSTPPPAAGVAAGPAQAGGESADPIRSRILRAAGRVFGEHGYAATSVGAILEASGVSRRTFYKKFRGKEDVLRCLFERSVQLLLRAATSAADEQGALRVDPQEITRASVDAYVRALAEAGPLARVLLLEQLSPDSPLAQPREHAQRAFAHLLSQGAVLRGGPPPDPILVSGVAVAINQICVEMSEQHPDGDWDVVRARNAILKLISALD